MAATTLRTLPPQPQSVALARSLATAAVGDLALPHERVEAFRRLVAEMVSSVIVATLSEVEVRVKIAADVVRVEVTRKAVLRRSRRAADVTETWADLKVIKRTADRWGVAQNEWRNTLWCELDVA